MSSSIVSQWWTAPAAAAGATTTTWTAPNPSTTGAWGCDSETDSSFYEGIVQQRPRILETKTGKDRSSVVLTSDLFTLRFKKARIITVFWKYPEALIYVVSLLNTDHFISREFLFQWEFYPLNLLEPLGYCLLKPGQGESAQKNMIMVFAT